MSDSIFEIGAPGCDTEKIVGEVLAAAAAKREKGEYSEPPTVGARRKSLALAQNEEGFVNVYRESLRDAVFVDINDFEIAERRTTFAAIFLAIKRVLWKSLKFYTYRLWSQQNQINGLLLSSIESAEDNSCARIKELEDRIKALEQKLSARGDIPPGSY